MYNPLLDEIENVTAKIIGDTTYHGKRVVLVDDAIMALEELERKLSAIYQKEIDRIRMVHDNNYSLLR